MKSDFLIALTQLAAERHLPKEQVLQAIEAALASAFKKDSMAVGQNISVRLSPNAGEPVSVYALKTVVETVEDPTREIDLAEAHKIKEGAVLGDEVPMEPLPLQFSRIAAQTAKQVVLQRLREVERELVFQEFVQRTDDVISGVVDQIEPGRVVIVDVGRAQTVLTPDEQVPTERYRKGQRLKVYVLDVRRTSKGPEIVVSRSHKNLLKRLFEIEVPEVFNGIVEIKAVARESGSRSKVAVVSKQQGVDPVGSCIGMRGNRIQSVVNELQGEKIDVVRWDKDLKVFISNALSPSEVLQVVFEEDNETAVVVVPERQLSLAIGKEGQNARLAAKLTGFRLDIKSMAEWEIIRAERHAEAQARLASVGTEGETISTAAVAEPGPELPAPEAEPALVAEAPPEERLVAEALERSSEAEVLIEEEALTPQGIQEPVLAEAGPRLSPEEELALLAFGEDEEALEEEEEEEVVEEVGDDVWQVGVPVAPSGPGTIRFAEDIMGDFRGRGRRDRKSKRGQAGRGKARRPGGPGGQGTPRPTPL